MGAFETGAGGGGAADDAAGDDAGAVDPDVPFLSIAEITASLTPADFNALRSATSS